MAAPPEVPICVDLDASSGGCVMTTSLKRFEVVGDEWKALKKNSLVLPSDSWAQIKIYILEMCKLNSNCAEQLPVIEEKINRLTY